MYCCFKRVLHFLCSQLNVTAAEDSVAEKSFTGIETKPNETVAVPIARAGMEVSVSIAANVEQTREYPGERRQVDARRDPRAPVFREGLDLRAQVRRLPSARGAGKRRAEAPL